MAKQKIPVEDMDVFTYYKEPIFKDAAGKPDEVELLSVEEQKVAVAFPITSVGIIASFVDPLSSSGDLDEASSRFRADEKLSSIPIESEAGGVIGLVSRAALLLRPKSALDALRSASIEKYLDRDTAILDADENVEKALSSLLERHSSSIFNDFLIYRHNRFFGTGSFLALTKQVALIRGMDLQGARSIQEFLLSRNKIDSEKLAVETYFRMAHEVGGDFIQTLELKKSLYMVASFDVCGKNIAASLATSLLSSFFATLKTGGLLAGHSPASLVEALNKVILDQTPEELFIAGALVFFDTEKRELTIFNCGYSPIYVFFSAPDGRNKCRIYSSSLCPLGLEPFAKVEGNGQTMPFFTNLKVFMNSDGLTDLKNESGERYDDEKLKHFLFSRVDLGPRELIAELDGEVSAFMGKALQPDDITALAAQLR
jgi:sigma-B regulation protein RsbU (phosphoserine phosphatase)